MLSKIDEAIIFATNCHEGQFRKLTRIPYILHPLEVSTIISSFTTDEDVIIAGLLHDVIEECEVDPKEIKDRFGVRVSSLVQSETEDKLSDKPKADTWLDRKKESLVMLEYTKDIAVKMLWLGDKLSNIRSFYREYLKKGDNVWLELHQKDKNMQKWYYVTIKELLKELDYTFAYQEYCELVDKLFK